MKLNSLFMNIWNRSLKSNFQSLLKRVGLSRFYGDYSWLEDFPRYSFTGVYFLKREIQIVDSVSFLSTYRELFENEIYKFVTQSSVPYIIDCGANIGLSVIYFKKLYPNAEIIAFEPDGDVFDVLEYNIKAFNFSNVKLVKKGIWNKEGVLRFYAEGADGGRIALDSDKENIIEIETVGLRTFLERPVDFLKIDIEGAETDVLEDCKDLLKNVSKLFVEYHSFSRRSQTLDKILKIMSESGFRYHIQSVGAFLPQPFCEQGLDTDMDMQLNIFAFR